MSAALSIACLSHVASPAAPTGAERSLALLARGLRARGHRIAVIAPGPWALAEGLAREGVEVRVVSTRAAWLTYWEPRPIPVALAKWAYAALDRSGRRRLAEDLREWRPDVVHVNCLPHVGGAAAAARTGRPVVWHIREIVPPGPRRRWLARRIAAHADAVVAVSEAVAAWLREEGLATRVRVVPNGVEPPLAPLDARAARRALGLDLDGVVVGLFGQLVPHKGALAFVEAARLAVQEERSLRFVLAGAGPESFVAGVRAAIQATGYAAAFRLLPPQPSGEALVAASDVVCLATTTPDPFPRAVLEAMGAARPVVAFDAGGTCEMVAGGETGILVPIGDVSGLAAAFVRLARDEMLRRSFGERGAERARSEFSLDRHVSAMETLFQSLAV